MNTEVAYDSLTFSTSHPDHVHTPDAENTSELDATCPDQQIVEGCDSCVEPMSDGVSTQPQEKSCTLTPPESSSENTPAPDSCSPDTQSESISVCAVDQDATLTTGGLPLLLTCAGDQPSDVGGAPGEACSANQTPAQLEEHQGEGEALTFTQVSPEQVTQAQHDGSSPTQGTTQQLMEVKDVLVLPEYGSLDPDPPASVEVPSSGPISVAMASMEPLRAVFQALDQDGDGFVRMEEFLEFAAAYGAEQVKDLTRFLDPSGLGVISFEDFHRGITAISNGGSEPDLYRLELNATDARLPAEEYDEQAEVSDSVYLGSESAYSECETFTDEDTGALAPPELHEDVETDSGIENTLTEGDDHRNRFSLGADLHGHALSAVIGGEEEHFEDFGESNTSDLLLANHEEGRPGPEDAGDPEPHPHPGSPKLCPPVLSPSSGKRLSSKKAARLLQNSALGLEGMGDLRHGLLDLTDTDITDKVLLLERRVCELEQDSALSEEQHGRLRQENLTLVHRANALEEQLKEQELRADDTLHTHARKHRDAQAKLQRERDLEIENLQARLQQLDEENSELRSCVPCLRANIERLEEEKRKLQDEVEDMSERLNEELDSRRKMTDKLSHERHNNQKEKECMQELIEDLRKQLEHLQLFKLEMEAKRGRSPSAGLQEYNTRTREHELEQEIRRLKQDNRSLKEQNDELNGQIINLSIQGAKSLVSESFSESLAAEINSVSRGELMEAIHKQKEINFRLQDYIDRIIVAIMECNPSILEVK
ncbi:rab11 family-interacting protein 3 isoform X2 [Sardina pilchardus]|uniref:rab11 family-interacting protein 3 isoform X2 n=1 Tax=Sardina pilchardus TaxID=27697 RepID=UPI002E14C4E7